MGEVSKTGWLSGVVEDVAWTDSFISWACCYVESRTSLLHSTMPYDQRYGHIDLILTSIDDPI
jgi:hypothetical protein